MKYALFTGATGGLGELCVRALSESGQWTVFAGGTNGEKLAVLGGLPNVVSVRLDVTSPESVLEARNTVLERTAALDAVVNFAGLTAFGSMVEGDCLAQMERLIDVNVMGMARVNKVFFDLVLAGGGRIINCSSESGWMTPQPFTGPYAMTKYAVEAYNDSLRRELMYLGIPVVKLQPGNYKTQITRNLYAEFDRFLSETKHYKQVLVKMKPMMTTELETDNDPRKLVKTVLKALNAKRPRLCYRVGTGKLLRLLELLPDGLLDRAYRFVMRKEMKAGMGMEGYS